MEERGRAAKHITVLGIYLNVTLTLFKILAGIVGKSEAIIADAVHSFSDLSTDIAVLWGFPASEKPIDKSHDYGHGKIETLVCSFIGLVLLVVGGGILWHGCIDVIRGIRGEMVIEPRWIAFYAAVISIFSKEWLYRRTVAVGKKIGSQAIIANAWHHRSDALSSTGVMFGIGGAIVLGNKWGILDPIAAIVVSLFILKMAVFTIFDSANELIEASLGEETKEEILRIVKAIPGTEHPHNLRTRRIGKTTAIEIHIRVSKKLNIIEAHDISTEVEKKLKERFGQDAFVSVHVEPVV